MSAPELFHAISDPESARVRRFVTEHNIEVRFRNVTYPEVMVDLQARGGASAPALWHQGVLSQGAEAVLKVLATLRST
jgi:hypothetical protein